MYVCTGYAYYQPGVHGTGLPLSPMVRVRVRVRSCPWAPHCTYYRSLSLSLSLTLTLTLTLTL